MNLQILIPTYNRSHYLLQNLDRLTHYIRDIGAQQRIGVVVCDNASPDGSAKAVQRFREQNADVQIDVLVQDRNVGLERNAVHVLDNATAPYVMFLGDDDFISLEYLREVDRVVGTQSVTCIVPAFTPIGLAGARLPARGRDENEPTAMYPGGARTAVAFLRRGHQLSGLTFVREGTLDAYHKRCSANMYLFMFFVGYNAMRGDVLHLTRHPVHVTTPDQSAKDWNYGNDGLACDRFKNAQGVFADVGWRWRVAAEWSLIRHNNRSFLLKSAKCGPKALVYYLGRTLSCAHCTLAARTLFLLEAPWQLTLFLLRRLKRWAARRMRGRRSNDR